MKKTTLLTLIFILASSPALALNITLYYNETTGQYETPGEYISSTLDTSSTNTYYCELSWVEDTPPVTDIVMQLRAGNSDPPSDCFRGIDGNCGTTYTSNPSWINTVHNLDRYMQWKSILSTTDTSVTPTLYSVAVTYTTEGDLGTYDCECVTRAQTTYQNECSDGETSCWDSFSSKCCGDDDNSTDYFYTTGSGGCVNRFGIAEADKIPPVMTSASVPVPITDYYYYRQLTPTTGIVYFNSALAQGHTINFNAIWTDANSDLGYDYLNAIKVSGLAGTITPKIGIPSQALDYTFSLSDNSGSLLIYARDAVHFNDSTAIIFTEDTISPTGSVIINNGDDYTTSPSAVLDITYSDNIEVRDCAFSHDNIMWTDWEQCATPKLFRLIPAEGTREVYFKVRDLAGNTHVSSDFIILDTTKPGLIINNDSTYTNSTDVILNLDMDFTGELLACYFRNDSMNWALLPCPLLPTPEQPVMDWTIEDQNGTRTVSILVNTSLGVTKESNDTIIYDPIPPAGNITIYSIGVPGFLESNEEYTAYTTVDLMLEFSDNEEVAGCRFANDDNKEANFTEFMECRTVQTWMLNDEEGLRTVYYQIIDSAGNINESFDTIYLNKTGAGLDVTPPQAAVVVDDSYWTNNNTMLHATWHGAYDHESVILTIPLVYDYSIGTSPGATDVVGWIYVGSETEFTHTGLSLNNNQTYYINVRVINSAGLTNESSSDGITVDTIAPVIYSLTSSHDEAIWNYKSQDNSPSFNWGGEDTISGVVAYSYALDQNNGTVPDKIPEGDINMLYAKNSTFYTHVIDGILYFHVRCLDNASNWGDVEHYEIRVDASPPTTPQIAEPNVTVNTTHLNYSWTTSHDIESGPVEYYFELSNSSGYEPGNIVNWTWTDRTNITVFGLVPDLTYYARVLARNLADFNSSWSSEVSTVFDQSGPDIKIIIPGSPEVCRVKSESPVIRVETDEYANCSFRENGSATSNDFDYTGSTYHESRSWLMSEGEHILIIRCRDRIGNIAERNRTFNITADASVSIHNLSFEDVYYTDRLAEITIILADKLGGVEGSSFNVELDNQNLTPEEFAVTDIGCGQYILAFDAPSIAGDYPLVITADSSSKVSTLAVKDLKLNISYYSSELLGQQLQYDKITYAGKDDTIIGIATDSYMSSISSISNNALELVSNPFEGNAYIFAVRKGADIGTRDDMLENKEFEDALNPSFGAVLEREIYRTEISLSYDNAILAGLLDLKSGRYKLLVRKTGIDNETGKNIINIIVSE